MTLLPVWNCTKKSLGERMDEDHDYESVFVQFFDLGIYVFLKMLVRRLVQTAPFWSDKNFSLYIISRLLHPPAGVTDR